jgi:hypothetical protein
MNAVTWHADKPANPIGRIERRLEVYTPDLVQADCDLIAGGYWRVWPDMLALNVCLGIMDTNTNRSDALMVFYLSASPGLAGSEKPDVPYVPGIDHERQAILPVRRDRLPDACVRFGEVIVHQIDHLPLVIQPILTLPARQGGVLMSQRWRHYYVVIKRRSPLSSTALRGTEPDSRYILDVT